MSNNASQRWKQLASSLHYKKKKSSENNVLTYDNFYYQIPNDDDLWLSIYDRDNRTYLFDLTFNEPISSIGDLIGFNNTGNTRIWPSEELLALFIRDNNSYTSTCKSICELGGGMTCFAALVARLNLFPDFVLLTDGNSRSVANLKRIVEKNGFMNCRVEQLLWNEIDAIDDKLIKSFDLVLCADCFFFTEFHCDLIDCIDRLMSENGRFVACAPQRGRTLEMFVEKAEKRFVVESFNEDFEKKLKRIDGVLHHSYEAPIVLVLTRRKIDL